jgi:hypothetical protein
MPDHRDVNESWWQNLWDRYTPITTPLRRRGIECDLAWTDDQYDVFAYLPDDTYFVISPGFGDAPGSHAVPTGWLVVHRYEEDVCAATLVYDSRPGGAQERHGAQLDPLLAAIDTHRAEGGRRTNPPVPTANRR